VINCGLRCLDLCLVPLYSVARGEDRLARYDITLDALLRSRTSTGISKVCRILPCSSSCHDGICGCNRRDPRSALVRWCRFRAGKLHSL